MAGKIILLIEDEESVKELVSLVLTEQGYQVLAASDPIEASQIMDRVDGAVEMLIVDSGLPVMSGEQFADKLIAKFPSTRVLMISGYPDGKRRMDSEKTVYPFLQKPFTPNQLSAKVKEILE